MAPRGLLLRVVALLAGACLNLQSAWAQRAVGTGSVVNNVTIFVEGTVQVYVTDFTSPKYAREANRANAYKPEYTYTLVERRASSVTPLEIPVNFGEKAGFLKTGWETYQGYSSNGRRLLSEEHEKARRMVLDFHNTKRSLQEFTSLADLLRTTSDALLPETPRADNPIVIEKTADKDLFVSDGKKQNLTSLTFVFRSSYCGLNPNLTAAIVRQWWYDNGVNAFVTASLQRYIRTCTYGQLSFRPENNRVIDVDIPCTGNTSYGPYNLMNGRGIGENVDNEKYALVELAKLHVQQTDRDVFNKWSSFRRKVMIFPFNWYKRYVSWTGSAAVGCVANADCYTWINSDTASRDYVDSASAFHELGHNIGLSHSDARECTSNRSGGAPSCALSRSSDPSDILGAGTVPEKRSQILCMNAPQASVSVVVPVGSYKAGWSGFVTGGLIRSFELQPGVSRVITLPSMSLNKNNLLRIVIDSSNLLNGLDNKPQQALFVSYRVRGNGSVAYDSGLNTSGRIWIHEYNDTANGVPADSSPALLTTLDTVSNGTVAAASFVQPLPLILGVVTGGINISLRSKTPESATVSLCRFTRRVETAGFCSDGLDNDW
ncbi:hypothetical protein VOLCADRAFT_99771 [Volvox carteri f. nagariensis]|uniref:Peptidase M11 gametolysin domain-containing protein n=1 Tax=Volvox carteri f. nagariensis TaxID=3068 RepID=D8UIL7_VOLCA|nr:uncharacterized protein VOLCADRAFT_99771 [Volvox carteri f. nagariensis]EFJ40418.1 hypothetical protein VOLCADRAFT_99771 [Volvox carteri f. nagariensis]|eukprot:XP_002958498.1 hypothetical protein VOLCADRAFT_99771 [Volvox carteri f. nagariensis]